MSQFKDNSIFWIEVERVKPNPYQPRREFDQDKLNDLAESIKQYGLLQPLTVTRKEIQRDDGSLFTEYELIAGERRLRASKIAGLAQVPAIIRSNEENDRVKLELAIIENLQREDLNPVERAQAFKQLAEEFGFKHAQIAKRVGKSREYVSNTMRLLSLPDDIKTALAGGKITEGHARPLLMLTDKPDEQETLFKEVMYKKLTVREAESIARRVAYDKVRKQSRAFDPGLVEMEEKLAESLGTRVMIEKRQVGGKIMIDFFSDDDLQKLLLLFNQSENIGNGSANSMLKNYIEKTEGVSRQVETNESPDNSEEVEIKEEEEIKEEDNDDNSSSEEESFEEAPEDSGFPGDFEEDDLGEDDDREDYDEKDNDDEGEDNDDKEYDNNDDDDDDDDDDEEEESSVPNYSEETKKDNGRTDFYSLENFSI